MGKYLELAALAKAQTPYDQNDLNDIRDKSDTYVRPNGRRPYDISQRHPSSDDLSAFSVVTSVVANPLNKDLNRICRFGRTLFELERRCPDRVPHERWRLAIDDGRRFLPAWGEQAEALGWTARDLFGLHNIPANPAPSYQRLARYDCTALIWLLQGCPVVALTEGTATIRMATGSKLTYRRHNKPAYGPLGDSIDDFLA